MGKPEVTTIEDGPAENTISRLARRFFRLKEVASDGTDVIQFIPWSEGDEPFLAIYLMRGGNETGLKFLPIDVSNADELAIEKHLREVLSYDVEIDSQYELTMDQALGLEP